jgi:hypothetical protein
MQLIVNLATSSGKSLRVGQISNFSLNQKKKITMNLICITECQIETTTKCY